MCAVQGAIVTTVAEHRVFPGQNLQAARYPSVKDVRSLPRLLHLSLASPWVHYSLGPFVVELFGGSAFDGVPAGVTRRTDQSPGQCLPTPATLCELGVPSPHPADGITP